MKPWLPRYLGLGSWPKFLFWTDHLQYDLINLREWLKFISYFILHTKNSLMILSLDNWWIAPNLLDVDIFQEIFSERSKLGAGARNTSLSIFWIISFPTRVKNLIRWSLNSAPRNKPHHPNQSFLSFRKGFPDHITHPRRLCNRITTSFTNKEKASGLFRIK